MKIAHVALWTADLDAAATFWATHFGAEIGDLYESRRRPGFTSRFLRLREGAVIELMSAPWLSGEGEQGRECYGWAHIALSLGSPRRRCRRPRRPPVRPWPNHRTGHPLPTYKGDLYKNDRNPGATGSNLLSVSM